jgi:hypothetical protein
MIKKASLFLILVSVMITGIVRAQNTKSPYSIFGPGEILSKGFGRNIGMGRAGIAVGSDNRLNNLNPASYAGIQPQHFIFEIGVDGKFSGFDSQNRKMTGFNANLRYLGFAFKITDKWAASLGISPYSTVGYNIITLNDIEGSLSKYASSFEGSGGITLAYLTQSLKITKNLFLGVNASYLFGPLVQQQTIVQSDLNVNYIITHNDYFRTFYFDYGLQYNFSVKKLKYEIGLIYANKQSLHSSYSMIIQDGNLSTVDANAGKNKTMKIPETGGVGLAVSNPGKFLVAADYQMQKWSGLKYPTMAGNFIDAHMFSAGLEIRPWKERVANKYFQNWQYRIGANYNSSYLKIGGQNIKGFGVNLGFGMPLRNQESTLNFAIEAGKNGTSNHNLIEEKYILFHMNFSINELWFIKRVFD